MSSEWDDYDNARIADQVMDHSKFRSESEDMDNQRRCNYTGVPYPTSYSSSTIHPNTNSTKDTPKNYHITDSRNPFCQHMYTNN